MGKVSEKKHRGEQENDRRKDTNMTAFSTVPLPPAVRQRVEEEKETSSRER